MSGSQYLSDVRGAHRGTSKLLSAKAPGGTIGQWLIGRLSAQSNSPVSPPGERRTSRLARPTDLALEFALEV